MLNNSKIEWTESTWNPITGCTKVSEGCTNCYAEKMSKRLHNMNNIRYIHSFNVTIHEDLINQPLNQKKSKMIFVCSMSDLFHEDVPDEIIIKIFETMNKANWHTFQVLTKRSERLLEISEKLIFSDNIWMGVTIENTDNLYRMNNLMKIKANTKFISFEPLLGIIPQGINLVGIDWAIVGGESGPKSRPIEENWVITIRDICERDNVSFFFKQWGGVNKKKNGRLLQGEIYNQFPKSK